MIYLNKDYIKYLLKRFFDIRDGEILRSMSMMIYIFLIISSLLIVKPVATALFLSAFGVEKLPIAFFLVAIAAAVVSTIYAQFIKRILLSKIIIRTLFFSITALILFWFLITFSFLEDWALYFFYIWMSLFGVLSASQFWILANMVFNSIEAKRLFGFIGAGAIAGGIFGGYVTTILVPFISSENMLLISAFFLSMCIPLVNVIWNRHVTNKHVKYQHKKVTDILVDHPISLILKSKHLTYLAAIVGISVIVAKLVDYQFSAVASYELRNEDSLAAFFGFWYSNLNLISLLIQIFLTRRVVGTYGVGSSLLFLPLSILFFSFSVLLFPVLASAVMLKIADGSLKQSINKAGIELLALPIPVNIKNQAKTFIDVFVDSLGSGIGGIFLIVLVIGFDLSVRYISLIIMILLAVWIYEVFLIRKEYIKSFMQKIDFTKNEKKEIIDFKNESVLGGIKNVIRNGKEKQILDVLRMTRDVKNNKLIPELVYLLKNNSTDVKIEAMNQLLNYKSSSPIPEILDQINQSNFEVRIIAFQYLFRNNVEFNSGYLKDHFNDNSEIKSCASIVAAAKEIRSNKELAERVDIEKVISQKLKNLETCSETDKRELIYSSCIRSAGYLNLKEYYGLIEESFYSSSPTIVGSAIEASGQTLDPRFLSFLIEKLDNNDFRDAAEKAIKNYGKEALEPLLQKLKSSETPNELRVNIPDIIGILGDQKTVDFLFHNLETDDITVRNESLKALYLLRKNYPHLKFSNQRIIRIIVEETSLYIDTLALLYSQINSASKIDKRVSEEYSDILDAKASLTDLLEKRLDGNLERIFKLLGLKYPPDEMFSVYRSIKNKVPDLHINIIEYLDNVLDTNLKKMIIPIIETAMLETITKETISNLNLRIPSEYECYEMLLNGKDIRIKIATLYLIKQLNNEKFLPLLYKLKDSPNKKINFLANESIVRIKSGN